MARKGTAEAGLPGLVSPNTDGFVLVAAGQLACSLCSESFMDAGTLYEHVLNNHNFPQSKPLVCSFKRLCKVFQVFLSTQIND